MAKQTVAQWATSEDAVPEAFKPQVTVYDEASGKRVATVFQAEAIPLIAAAPEMLAALEGVIHHNDALKEKYKLSPSLIRQVEAAISKAKGN